MFKRQELEAQLDIMSEQIDEIESLCQGSDATDRVRTKARQVFELASNVMDQAFFVVWQALIEPTLSAPNRERGKKQVVLPVADDQQGLGSSLGKFGALEAYRSLDSFRALVDRFQPFANGGDLCFKIVKEVARLKHSGLPKLDRSIEPRLYIRGIGHMVVRRIRLDYRDQGTRREYRLFVDGNAYNEATGKYDLPLPPGVAGIENFAQYFLDGTGPEVIRLLRDANQKLRERLADFEALARP